MSSGLTTADLPPLTYWLTGLILALVLFVIVFPALCTACYHYISYKKGWDYDEEDFVQGLNLPDIDCGSECSECRKQFAEEGQVTGRQHWQYYFRVMTAMNEQARLAAATAMGPLVTSFIQPPDTPSGSESIEMTNRNQPEQESAQLPVMENHLNQETQS